jgi:hypothetical protein
VRRGFPEWRGAATRGRVRSGVPPPLIFLTESKRRKIPIYAHRRKKEKTNDVEETLVNSLQDPKILKMTQHCWNFSTILMTLYGSEIFLC